MFDNEQNVSHSKKDFIWAFKYAPDKISDLILLDKHKAKFDRIVQTKHLPDTLLYGPPGTGKAQPLNSLVLTEKGFVKMKDIKIGDKLASVDGQENIVTGIFSQGQKEVYEIVFSDGRKTQCCGDHLWRVKHNDWKTPRVLSTEELLEKRKKKTYKKTINVPLYSGQFSSNSEPSIDSWLLGMLLGDGSLGESTPRITKKDKRVIEKIKERLPKNTQLKHINKHDYIIVSSTPKHVKGVVGAVKSNIQNILIDLRLLGKKSYEKFIPTCYLNLSYSQRGELLAGLIDSDGYIDKRGAISYSTSSKQLADDVVYLVRSLGGISSYTERVPSYTYKGEKRTGRKNYNITIYLSNIHKLQLFSHKKERLKKRERHRTLNVVSIEKIKKDVCQCLSVSHNSKLYITDEFITTHNTTLINVLKNELNLNMLYINGSLDNSISVIRSDVKTFSRRSSVNQKAVFIDEFEQMSGGKADAQNSLKAEIENCKKTVFLFATNHIESIIDPLISRCGGGISFYFNNDEKKELQKKYYKRSVEILELENVEFEPQAVAKVVQNFFPDMRNIIHNLQDIYNQYDKIELNAVQSILSTDLKEFFELIKSKNLNKIREYCVNLNSDYVMFYGTLVKQIEKYVHPDSIGNVISHCYEHMKTTSISADRELPLVHFCYMLLNENLK